MEPTDDEILRTIFDHVPVMIGFVGVDGRIELVNREWQRILGWSLEEAVALGTDFYDRCLPDPRDRKRALKFLAESNGEWMDFKATVRDGRVVDLSWLVVRLSDGTSIGIGTDVTIRKRIEEAEREQRDFAEALRDSAAALNSTLDLDEVVQRILDTVGRLVPHDAACVVLRENDRWHGYASRSWAGLGGVGGEEPRRSARDPTGVPRAATLDHSGAPPRTQPDDVGAGGGDVAGRVAATGAVDRERGASPLPAWARSHVDAPIRVDGRPIGMLTLASSAAGFFGERDVTRLHAFVEQAALALENARLLCEVYAARERLESLSNQLIVAEEAERRRIARELHDDVGQVLTAVGANLRAVELSPERTTLFRRLEDSLDLIDGALKRIRDLSLELRPSVLDDFGLVRALEWYVERVAQRTGLTAAFVADPSSRTRLPGSLETTCFRVAQIALTNVARHARARQVSVELREGATDLLLTIRDDGVGFDVPACMERASRGATLGLLSMHERVRLANGRIEITSAPHQGTEVRARFPLRSTDAAPPAPPALPSGPG